MRLSHSTVNIAFRASRNTPIHTSRIPNLQTPIYGARYLQTLIDKPDLALGKRDLSPKIVRGQSKLWKDADAAVADLQSGSVILSAGFGLCGTAGKF